jgi:hypothetical protein
MRPYTPDSGLNILGINNSLGSDYSLRLCRHCDGISSMFFIEHSWHQHLAASRHGKRVVGYSSEKYRIDFCRGAPGSRPARPLITRESTTTDMIMGRGAYDNTGTPKPKPKPPPKRPAAQDSATAWICHAADRTPRSVDRLLRLRPPWSRRHRALRWYQLDVPNSGVQWLC